MRRPTICQLGNPTSNGKILSRYFICSSDNEILSASRFACSCSTFRPPMIGMTNGALCMTYAIATVKYHANQTNRLVKLQKKQLHPQLTGSQMLRSHFLRHFLEGSAHLFLVFSALPVGSKDRSSLFASLSTVFLLSIAPETSTIEHIPWCDGHAY